MSNNYLDINCTFNSDAPIAAIRASVGSATDSSSETVILSPSIEVSFVSIEPTDNGMSSVFFLSRVIN